ncbi:MAG: permease-like cell division protein FtsX [Oscillospiraceae bacterium]|nr:permease-like cell division protein FtsX [Oscillospiraceae bacterium]MBQ5442646.1 permease-like cell division protein FtsX [Oscillospiraceae bacterium]
MSRHNLAYFAQEGLGNLFSHGFMSFAAIGITVACLLVMGTFSLVAYNAEIQLETLESEYEILAFVDETYDDAQVQAVGAKLQALPNVKSCQFISREEATKSFEEKHEGDYMLQDLDASIFRDRYAVYVNDLNRVRQTASAIYGVEGVAKVRVDEDIAGGFIMLRNVAGVVCLALIAILLVVSIFIISNTIRLTTFDRRDEIAIMKMVGATDGFIRWPFVYEGFMLGILSALIAFGLQWLLYESVAKGIAASDTLQILHIVPFADIWKPVAAFFGGVGLLVGVGGSLTAIRKFLHV